MTDLTPDRLAELRALADAATEGPWWGGGNNRRRDAIGLVGRTSDRGTGNAIAVLNGIGMDRTADATSQNFSTREVGRASCRERV